MSHHMSAGWPKLQLDSGFDVLGHEILAEKAAALGRAGERMRLKLAEFRASPADAHDREAVLKETAEAVQSYFIQRELCGLRSHDVIIREQAIPGAVLARLGAR